MHAPFVPSKIGLALAALAAMSLSAGTSLPGARRATVIHEMGHALSPPLRTLAGGSLGFQGEDDGDSPIADGVKAATADALDPVRQTTASGPLVTIPGLNLLGLGVGFTGPSGSESPHGVPPDPNAAVGAFQVVETVNLSLAVFDKTTGAVTLGPVPIGSIWKKFNPSCADGASLADPIVLYDKLAGRWVMKIGTLTTPYMACLAVSKTGDATGAWYLYAFTIQAEGRYTGQKMTTWPDAYYLNASIYNNSGYVGPSACAVDRSRMLIGQTATMQCIQMEAAQFSGMLPCDLDGPNAPPAGSPNYFMVQGPPKSNALYLYQMHVDFTTPANTTLTGPTVIAVAPYTDANQVPQFATTQQLNTNGTGLMPRLSYRNFANATPPYESLMVAHAIVTKQGSQEGVAMRWYEIRSPGSTPVVYQQGTYAPDMSYRWMGAIAMDGFGDMALGYTISTTTGYPSVRYTGRQAADPLGTMEAEATIYDGSGYQEDSDRWGDYTSMSVDPADDCTMWYTGQYMAGTGNYEWATRLFSFQFPACQQAAKKRATNSR